MLVAIGSLHESLKSGLVQQVDSGAVNLYKYAEAEYTRAVSLLNTHMTHRGWSALEITLVCSILGIMFEWLRGGYQDAVRHLTSSFKILSTWLSHNAPSSTTTFGSPGGHLIRSQIKPIFHILVLQPRMLPIPPSVPPKVVQAPEQTIPEFSSVAHARNVQLDLLTYVLVVPPKVAGNKGRTHQILAGPLSQWSDNFALFISQQPQLASDARVKILKVWRVITEIIYLSPFSSERSSFHGLNTQLSTFLDDIESRRISVDIGAVAVFFYTASYCRHPETHRRAIAFLESAGGPWGHHVAIKAQQEYTRIEDSNPDFGSS